MYPNGKIEQLLAEYGDVIISDIVEDQNGNIWLSDQNNGLIKLQESSADHFETSLYKPLPDGNSLHATNILALECDNQNQIWIGIENGGLDILNVNSEVFTHLSSDKSDPLSLSSNSIWEVKKDHHNRVWVGSYEKGLDVWDPYQKPFGKKSTQALQAVSVYSFSEDSKGNIWIGGDGHGLDYYDVNDDSYTQHFESDKNNSNSLINNSVIKLLVDKDDNLLVGTWAGGLNHYNTTTKRFTHYLNDPNDPTSIAANSIFSLTQDPINPNGIWVATWSSGLDYFDLRTKTFKHLHAAEESAESINIFIRDMAFDQEGQLWIGTVDGLYKLIVDRTNYTYNAKKYSWINGDSTSLSENKITCIRVTDSNQIWIGSENEGLNLYLPEEDKFRVFNKDSGLPNNGIKSIIDDPKGNLWVGTPDGLLKLALSGQGENTNIKVSLYDQGDGLWQEEEQ